MGSDFDGGPTLPRGMRDIRDLRSGEMVPHVYRGRVLHTPSEPGSTTMRMEPAGEPEPETAPEPEPEPEAEGPEPGAVKAFYYRARGKLRSMLSG